MGYRVRSEGGEVKFASLYDLQKWGLRQGLVSGEDDVAEGDSNVWRKVKELPAVDLKPESNGFWKTKTGRWVIPLCALSAVTLGLLFVERYRVAGLGLAIFVALLLSQFTFKVFSRRQVR